MPRDRLTFRQRDVKAAIKSVEQATGRQVTRLEIGQDGRIIVELAPPVASGTAPAPELNPWDEVPDIWHETKGRSTNRAASKRV